MNSKNREVIFVGLVLIGMLILTNFVSAAQIGISPSQINFKGVLRGGYSERTVTISTDSETKTKVELQPRGDILDWLNFSAMEFEISKETPYLLTISTSPPTGTPNGNYSGYLRVKTTQQNGEIKEGQATSTVLPVVDLLVNVEVTDVEYFECLANNFVINSVEEGENLIFKTSVKNLGNVIINPELKIDIWDSEQLQILKTETYSEVGVIPTTEKEIEIVMNSKGLKIGQYWVDISVIECYASQTLTFDILEEGSLRANGILTNIISNPWIAVGETTIIEAVFMNTGEKNVNSYFEGKISQGTKTIQLLKSEKINVLTGEDNTYQFYFTPRKVGRYVVSGRIFYDNKKTFEKATIINVQTEKITLGKVLQVLIYVFLIFGIAFLLYKIRKEKNTYQLKLRRIRK